MPEHETPRSVAEIARDQFRFLRSLAERPRMTGAIAPSGPQLARQMASHVDPASPLPVLELGPGTGVVTKAILERGVAPERLVALEYSPDFVGLLRERFPGVNVVRGDAYNFAAFLPAGRKPPFCAIISSLPLVAKPVPERQALVEAALDAVVPGGPYIQFSYSPFPPAPPLAGRFTATPSHWIVMNLPPARVWVYRRPG